MRCSGTAAGYDDEDGDENAVATGDFAFHGTGGEAGIKSPNLARQWGPRERTGAGGLVGKTFSGWEGRGGSTAKGECYKCGEVR